MGKPNEDVMFTLEDISSFSDPVVLKRAIQVINEYKATNDEFSQCYYMQRIKVNGKYSWISNTKTIFDEFHYFSVGYLIETIDKLGIKIRDLLDEVHVDKNGWHNFELLGKREHQIPQKVGAGYSSVEIADQLHISKHTVRTHRRNLYNKLEAKSNADLVKFAQAFEMI